MTEPLDRSHHRALERGSVHGPSVRWSGADLVPGGMRAVSGTPARHPGTAGLRRDDARSLLSRRANEPVLLTVNGGSAELRSIAGQVAAVVEQAGVPSGRSPDVELAVHETLVNAVAHGHLGDGEVPIEVGLVCDDTTVCVLVRDRAMGGARPSKGGSVDNVTGRCADSNRTLDAASTSGGVRLAERGHGTTLIEGCCDEVVWRSVADVRAGDGTGPLTEVVLTWRR